MTAPSDRYRTSRPPGLFFPGLQGLCGLEGSGYMSAGSPLMMLANEMGRPFNVVGDNNKAAFSSPPPGLLFDSFPSLHQPPTFGGAFRPLQDDPRNGFHGSAFAPAAKSTTIIKSDVYETSSSFLSPCSGTSADIKAEDEDRTSETPASDATDSSCTERLTPDEGRQLRKAKKRGLCAEESCCPVCGVTVRPTDLYLHFRHEVEKLTKIARSVQRPPRESTPSNKSSSSPSGSSRKRDSTSEKGTPESRWEMYERVKASRQNRLNARANRGKRKKSPDDPTCPVCKDRMSGSLEEMNEHVVLCLRRREGNGSEEEPVDVEGDETFEEYEWAGQTRVRATSLLSGGLSALGFQANRKSAEDEDDDQDLNVDGDDSVAYGHPQYSEADIILCGSDDDKARSRLRQAVIMNGEEPPTRYQESSYWSSETAGIKQEAEEQEACSTTTADSSEQRVTDSERVLSSLKERISELEEIKKGERLRCLVCMESYRKPVVSVCCWHVHCEECWLRTLGAKKLCPQCSAITSPTDLRRIYL